MNQTSTQMPLNDNLLMLNGTRLERLTIAVNILMREKTNGVVE